MFGTVKDLQTWTAMALVQMVVQPVVVVSFISFSFHKSTGSRNNNKRTAAEIQRNKRRQGADDEFRGIYGLQSLGRGHARKCYDY
jgi:hypothetical protein